MRCLINGQSLAPTLRELSREGLQPETSSEIGEIASGSREAA